MKLINKKTGQIIVFKYTNSENIDKYFKNIKHLLNNDKNYEIEDENYENIINIMEILNTIIKSIIYSAFLFDKFDEIINKIDEKKFDNVIKINKDNYYLFN